MGPIYILISHESMMANKTANDVTVIIKYVLHDVILNVN